MAFWQTTGAEPKRNHRYQVTIQGSGQGSSGTGDSIIYWAKAVTLPSFDVSNAEIHHYDNRYYFPGRVTWNPVSFTLVDPVTPDAAAQVSNFLKNMGYFVPALPGDKGSSGNPATISRKASADGSATSAAMFQCKVDVYNSTGTIIESWGMMNCFIESAKFGDLAYDNDELKTIEMSVRYDYADKTV